MIGGYYLSRAILSNVLLIGQSRKAWPRATVTVHPGPHFVCATLRHWTVGKNMYARESSGTAVRSFNMCAAIAPAAAAASGPETSIANVRLSQPLGPII